MPTCQVLLENGNRCSVSANETPYFWFRDSHKLISKEYNICQDHSQTVFSKLLLKEYQQKTIIETIDRKIKNLQAKLKTEKNWNNNKEIKIEFEKKKRMYEHLNTIRNRTCRLCNYPLNEPDDPKKQWSQKYTHIDLHSPRGYRREVLLFHSLCGRIWLLANMFLDEKEKSWLQPAKTGQFTLEQVISN